MLSPRHQWTLTLHCGHTPIISSHVCGTRGGSTHRARGAPGRSTQTAWGMWGARGAPEQHEKELVQRKGRAVKAAADDAQARGFKGPTFHFNSTPGTAVFPPDRPSPSRSHSRGSSSGFSSTGHLQPCDGAVSEGSPGGVAQGHPCEGVDPQPDPQPACFSSLEGGRKAELGAEGASGPGSDTSKIREVCGLEPKHRMCSRGRAGGGSTEFGTVNPFVRWA